MRTAFLLLVLAAATLSAQAQYSRADSLRGSLNPDRTWWDVQHYALEVAVDIDQKSISGKNTIVFRKLAGGRKMQIDLQPPMKVDSVFFHGSKCSWTQSFNAWVLSLPDSSLATDSVIVHFSGKPRPAKFAPWDGGFSWTKDEKGRPWVAVSCQGLGASVWWPNKDHQYDEPDLGMRIAVTVPDTLVNISNGRLQSVTSNNNKTRTFRYRVLNPINNYDVTLNIGKYVTVRDSFLGQKGRLDMEYCVLDYNLPKVKKHLVSDAQAMLRCFEFWFGPYPFYDDGYRLVETPYLGMEHQSAIAYGNKFRKGYMGMDRSRTGAGLLWDFIIVHESGHEWFGNNITCQDNADMWIHEGFTTYSEVLFTQCTHGKDTAGKYMMGLRKSVLNDKNIIGDYGVNREGSNDMYEKAAAMIHTIRHIISDDTLFRKILLGMNADFAKQTVTTRQIEDYWIEKSGKDLQPVFDQFLRNTGTPVLNYRLKKNTLYFYFSNCRKDFRMPVKMIAANGKELWITGSTAKGKIQIPPGMEGLRPDENFYLKPLLIK